MAFGLILATLISAVVSKKQGDKQLEQQERLSAAANRVAPPPMERSDEGPQVQLGTVDNELKASSRGAGNAVAGVQRLNQIGQLGGGDE